MSNTQVGQTIIEQLGGRRFIAFTGAWNFLTLSEGEEGVSFRLPLKRKGPNYWKIRLTGRDDYDIQTFYIHGRDKTTGRPNVTALKTFEGIYCDQLVEIFERETGLRTKL